MCVRVRERGVLYVYGGEGERGVVHVRAREGEA